MEVAKLLDLVTKIRQLEYLRLREPFEQALNQEFVKRAPPLVRPRGTPTREKLHARYRMYDVGALFHIFDKPEHKQWLIGAMENRFLFESNFLEYALTIPMGLRYTLEAVSNYGLFDTLRRMREAYGSGKLLVANPLMFQLTMIAGDIPIVSSYPPPSETGVFGLYTFYTQYLKRSVVSATAGVVWVGLTPPTPLIFFLEIDLPKWTGGLDLASPPPLHDDVHLLLYLRRIPPKCPCRCPPEVRMCAFRHGPLWRRRRFYRDGF